MSNEVTSEQVTPVAEVVIQPTDQTEKKDYYIEVRNMNTNMRKSFKNLTPKEAVVWAFEESRENYHRWMYTEFDKHPDAFENPKSVVCGDWICKKNLPQT